jgi:hypothetical protein
MQNEIRYVIHKSWRYPSTTNYDHPAWGDKYVSYFTDLDEAIAMAHWLSTRIWVYDGGYSFLSIARVDWTLSDTQYWETVVIPLLESQASVEEIAEAMERDMYGY